MRQMIDYSPHGGQVGRRFLMAMHAAAFLYPFLLVAAFYVPWLLAWAALGHPPRASWDDPAETVGPIYWACASVVPLMPLAALAAVASVVCRFAMHTRSRVTAVLWAALIPGLWLIAMGLLRWDPLGVSYWWWD